MKTKKTIVFLSGLMCNETVWKDIEKELEGSYDISMISFKGLESIEEMAKKVLDISPSSFILIGHSMGGRVALEIYKQAPQRILSLGLFNTGVHSRGEKEKEGRQVLLDLALKEGIKAVSKQWLPPMMSISSLQNDDLMKQLYKMIETYSVDDFFKQIKALLNRPNAQDVLETILVPTLLLSGTEDKWSPTAQHEEMQKYIKNSTLAIVENANHMAPVEQPKKIASIISKWIEKNSNND